MIYNDDNDDDDDNDDSNNDDNNDDDSNNDDANDGKSMVIALIWVVFVEMIVIATK